jgi:hypothetical protein
MSDESLSLSGWTPEQIARGRAWALNWAETGKLLDQIHRKELREIDGYAAIALLCGPADYTQPPRAPQPTSGLIEQQRWFMKAAGRD